MSVVNLKRIAGFQDMTEITLTIKLYEAKDLDDENVFNLKPDGSMFYMKGKKNRKLIGSFKARFYRKQRFIKDLGQHIASNYRYMFIATLLLYRDGQEHRADGRTPNIMKLQDGDILNVYVM